MTCGGRTYTGVMGVIWRSAEGDIRFVYEVMLFGVRGSKFFSLMDVLCISPTLPSFSLLPLNSTNYHLHSPWQHLRPEALLVAIATCLLLMAGKLLYVVSWGLGSH